MGVSVAIGVGIGAVVGGAAAAIQSGGNFDSIWKGALVGAVGGAVGGWAAPALTGALGGTLGGMAAGAIGGVATGVLGTALSGGNSSDYLKAGLFGGLGGAAVGGITGSLGGLGGGEAGVNGELVAPAAGAEGAAALPTDASGIPLTESGAYAFDDAAQAASGMGSTGGGSEVINTSVTGAPASVPEYTAPQLDAGTQPLQFASNQTTTDVPLGSSATPQELPGGVPLNSPTAPTAEYSPFGGDVPSVSALKGSLGESAFTFDDYPSQAMIDTGVANPSNTTELVNSPGFKLKELGAGLGMDTFGFGKNATTAATTGTGNMDYSKAMKNLGLGQLLSGGIKTLGAAATAPETSQNRQQLMDLYNQQNAYLQQQQGQNQQAFQQNLNANTANQEAFRKQLAAAQGYNTQLQGTYEDPNSYLNSPEAQATRNLAMQKLLAQNAQAGRRSAGLSMQNQLMANQLQNLAAYRQGLRQSIQYPGQVQGMSYQQTNPAVAGNILNQAQAYSPTADILGGLASSATPLGLSYLFS